MKKDTVVSLKKPVEELAPLTALLRAGAQQLLCEAVAAELAEYLSQYQAWCVRDLRGRRYVYVWVDGIYFNVRGEDARQCLLVVIGVDEPGSGDHGV